jgi:tetratricopeptide (TPR) repeat protein
MLPALLLAFAPPAPVQETTTTALELATQLWASDRSIEALASLADHVARGAQQLVQLEGEPAAKLADKLELALVYYDQIAARVGDPLLARTHAEHILVDPQYGMLFARLARMRGRVVEDLHPLLAWEFVGPFDNERGQGMLRVTPPGKEPDAATYEGKLRAVGWRVLPASAPPASPPPASPPPASPPPDGVVRFARLLDPSSQACVIARTWIHSTEPREVLLLLGASEEVRVWFEGTDVHAALGAHSLAADTWCVPLTLKAGWNELALEVGSLDGAPSFSARLVEPLSARPLSLEVTQLRPEGAPVRELLPGDAQQARTSRPGASTRWARPKGPEGFFRAALLAQEFQSSPRHERPGSEQIAAAQAARPGVLRYDLLGLSTLRVRGARPEEEDLSPWLAALDGALQAHGSRAILLRARGLHAWSHQPTYARALGWIEAALEVAPRSVLARFDHSHVLRLAGQSNLAEAELRDLAEDEALLAWPEVAWRVALRLPATHPARARLIARAREAGNGGAIDATRRRTALDRVALEQGSRAVSVSSVLEGLTEKLSTHPWSTVARRQAAGELLAMDAPAEALRLLDEALELAPDRAALHRWRARALMAMGEIEGATAALEAELELDFSAEDERRLLEHLRSLGGAPFHEAYAEPLEDVLARSAHDAPVDPSVAPRVVLLSRLVVEVQPDGTAKRYRRLVQRVLGEAGARELDRRGFRAWPGEEEVRVLAANVLHPNGSVDGARTGRTGRSGRSGRSGSVVVDLPPLAAGDVVDLEWRRDDLRPGHFGRYFGLDAPFSPDARLPVRESEIVLIVPASLPLTLNPRLPEGATYERHQREDGATVHRWVAHDLQPERVERLMPPAVEHAARVQASSYASWSEFGRWWWNLIEDEIRVSDEMRAKVAELTEGKSTPLERLRAVYDFVVTEVRYNAWEFGVHGYQPYSAPVIFSRRFGDCKDKAILLRAMLSAADIEAWPVLIRMEPRRYEEDHSLALIAHFNHCIAWVPAQEGLPEMFLDGTARLHPLDILPDSDAGARVVIVRDRDVLTTRIPFPEPERNLMWDKITVDLTGPEGPTVEMTRRPNGRFDPQHRHQFTGNPEERAEEVERFLTSTFGALRGEPHMTAGDFEDLDSPLELEFEAGIQEISRPAEGGFELPTTFGELDLLRSVASETERTTDLLLDVPWSRETELRYRLGEGARPVDLPAPVKVETEDAAYSRTVEVEGDGLVVRERFVLKSHRIPVDRYPAFREFARTVDAAQDVALRVEVGQ